jgi:hypothetical protein
MISHCLSLLLGLTASLGAQPGAVLLRNGEVFLGQIEARDGEVRVLLPNGEVRFRAADVEYTAATVGDLYLRKRAAMLPDDAQERLRLAQWCIRQGLFAEADAEIDAARAIDPCNPAVELMRRRLELGRLPPQVAKKTALLPHTANELDQLDRLVHAMPDRSVEAFTQRVQPTLMNTCATAACHGPQSESKLQLLRVVGGRPAGRRLTQRNLQALLPWIDQQQPAASPLLKYATTVHAGGKVPPLAPESLQYRRLLEWVYQMAREEDHLPPIEAPKHLAGPSKTPLDSKAVLTSATEPAQTSKVRHSRDVVRAGGPPADAAAPVNMPPNEAPATKSEPHPAPGSDPFDPEVFNRRFLK